MMKIFKYFLFAVLFLNLYSETQVHAKPVPPGSGEGDVPANILFLINSSARLCSVLRGRAALFGVAGVAFGAVFVFLAGHRCLLGVVVFAAVGWRGWGFGCAAAGWPGPFAATCAAGLGFASWGGTGYCSVVTDAGTRAGSKVRVSL
jgi:hypothetical protein